MEKQVQHFRRLNCIYGIKAKTAEGNAMKMYRKGFSRAAVVIAISAVFVAAAVAGALIVNAHKDKGEDGSRQRCERRDGVVTQIRGVVSDYDLEIHESVKVMDKWRITKDDFRGPVRLNVYCSSSYRSNAPRDHVTYYVYDSVLDAIKAYRSTKDRFEGYTGFEEIGDTWFIGWEPDVCDASIKQVVCIEGNVILTAEVEFISEWPEYYDDDNDVEIEVQPPSFDSSIMREYVVEHSVELRDYVLNVILEA